jgi:hypothetical protein
MPPKKATATATTSTTADIFSTTSPLKMYDIFKNTVNPADVTKIEQLLANLAVGDTSHDIDKKDKGILGITGKLNDYKSVEANMYIKGIPFPYEVVPNEEGAISSVIKSPSFEWVQNPPPTIYHNDNFKRRKYVPLEVMKYIKEGILPDLKIPTSDLTFIKPNLTKHKFETENGNKYIVTYFDVKPETRPGVKGELIDAQTFFTNMGYATTVAKNIAFVVDCTSITIEDILNKGNPVNANFKTYLIKSPEGENDPGGKTNLQDKSFKTANGVRYRAAVPHNLNKSNSYNYSYKEFSISPYTQFFTNYSFNLSELQFDDKYIFSSLSTTINITGKDNNVPTKTVLNSGNMNEIAAVSNVVRNVLAKIVKFNNKYSNFDTFDYNCALQQKRSGDWLQALLCCLVALGKRKFCEYNSPAFTLGSLFKKKEISSGTENSPELTFFKEDVYLVTHDRILLAFALLLGINVIFTHHYTGSGKGYSFHSALVYKIEDPLEKSQSKLSVMEQFFDGLKAEQSSFATQLTNDRITLQNIYTRFTNHINRFKTGVPLLNAANNVEVGETVDNLNRHIAVFRGLIDNATTNPITADVINDYTQKIFSFAFKIALLRTTFPDLDNLGIYTGEIDSLFTKMDRIKSKLTTNVFNNYKHPSEPTESAADYFLQLDNERLSYDEIVKLLTEYNEISNRLKVIKKIYTDYGSYVVNMEKSLKKNPTFGVILAWRTSNIPKCNLWVQYNNVLKIDSAFINDKNIFLYELTKLDDESKNEICKVYYTLFEKIKIPANIAGAAALQAKIQQNVLSFCLEVFVNLGPFVTDDVIRSDIKSKIDTYLTSQIPAPADSPTANVFKPNRFNEVIEELNALNATKTENLRKADEKTINVVTIPEDKTYDPVVTPNLIEEIIEIKVNTTPGLTPKQKLDNQDITGDNVLALYRLDVKNEGLPDANIDEQNPTINLTSENVDPVSIIDGTFVQAGGKQKKFQDISFMFQNKIAPRYLAATNLFKPSWIQWSEPLFQRINNRLSGRATDETETSELIDTTALDSLEMPINVSIDEKLREMAIQPTTFQNIVKGTKNTIAIAAGAGIVYQFVLPIIKSRFFGGSSKEKSKNIIGGAKTITIEGEWDIKIVDDTHITLCNKENKCYPILLKEGEIEKVKAFLENPESQIESLISSDESILVNEKFAPHPLLSIYLTLDSYCNELDVTSIEDSWDYEKFIQFFVLTNKMVNNLLKIYSKENKTNMNELKACMVGYGLRELIFTSPQYIERDPICRESLNIELDNYNPLSKMFSIFVNRVCGSVNQTPEDIEFGSKHISSPIFREYAQGIPFNKILDSNVGQVNTYELALKVQKLFLEVGNKIISDTNGIENDDLLNLTSIELPYLTETTVTAQGLAKNPVIAQVPMLEAKMPDNVAKGPSKYELLLQQREKTRLEKQEIESAKQMEFLRNNPIKMRTGNNITNYTSSKQFSPIYAEGGNTKKNKVHKKSKITRGKTRNYKNKTRKNKKNKKVNTRSKRNI